MTKLHSLKDPEEQDRIKDAGFMIQESNNILRVYNPFNVSCGINMTRSIGDFMFKINLKSFDQESEYFALSNEADVVEFDFSTERGATDMLVLGCDGIWDGTEYKETETMSQDGGQELPKGHQVLKFLHEKICFENGNTENP